MLFACYRLWVMSIWPCDGFSVSESSFQTENKSAVWAERKSVEVVVGEGVVIMVVLSGVVGMVGLIVGHPVSVVGIVVGTAGISVGVVWVVVEIVWVVGIAVGIVDIVAVKLFCTVFLKNIFSSLFLRLLNEVSISSSCWIPGCFLICWFSA